MPKRDIIVVGASAGGLDAVTGILKGLPKKLPAAIFIVSHTSPDGPGLLSGVLHRLSPLPVTTAQDRERIVSGQVYVAPPDFHLLHTRGHVRVRKGPRIALVQDPKDAMVSLAQVENRKSGAPASQEPGPEEPGTDALETSTLHGPPSPFTCPDCGGALWELRSGKLVRYRCHVGHGYNVESVMAAQDGKLEETLWSALRAIEESLEPRKRMVDRARRGNLGGMVPRLEQEIADLSRRADALSDLLIGDEPPPRRMRQRKKR